jgi:anthranilate synthase component II
VRVLFLENQDSFSWNVIEALPVTRAEVVIRAGHEAAADPAALDEADLVVVGPGPTDPLRAGIVDVVRAAAARARPLLGVCLGHQALGLAFGARIVAVPPVHGKRVPVVFGPSRCFPRFTGPEVVMRYNSLALEDVAPPLRVIARDEDGTVMAIEHERLPMAGLQFHPDSFGTRRGRALIADFFQAARGRS